MSTYTESRCQRGKPQYVVDALMTAPQFADVDSMELQELLSLFCIQSWPQNTTVVTPVTNQFYIIVAGRVKLTRCHPETGHELTLFLFGPGDFFDIGRLLNDHQDETIAVAVDDVEILSAPIATMRHWLDEHPKWQRQFVRYLGTQMSHLADLATDLSLYDTKTRLVKLLLRHVHTDSCQPRLIDNLRHEELASLIGSVRAVVNRHLQELKQQGSLQSRRSQLMVRDVRALEANLNGTMTKTTTTRLCAGKRTPRRGSRTSWTGQ